MNRITGYISNLFKNALFSNSFWGIFAQVAQSLFLSLFFVIIARIYSTREFSVYIVVNVLYQLIATVSALGLSQWFIREMSHCDVDKMDLQNKFFKIQFVLGLLFSGINILIAYLLYDDPQIHFLALLLSLNIVFDNLINAIKCVNIATFEQKKTFIILTIESFFRFLISCCLFIYPFSITTLTIILILVRFVSLNMFITFGSSNSVTLKGILRHSVIVKDATRLIFNNWPFIIINSVAIINWRISTIIISKVLTAIDIANYEISFKLFSIAQILPVVISATVFPSLIKLFNQGKGDIEPFKVFYKKVHLYYLLFGLLSYTFIFSFSDYLLPFAFGKAYLSTPVYAKQMFLTILIFPTAFLQANVLMAMKLEKLDMWFNVILLFVNVALCTVGLYFIKSLMVVNVAIFVSFLIFHISQDIILFKKNIVSLKHVMNFYIVSSSSIFSYVVLSKIVGPIFTFCIYWVIVMAYLLIKNRIDKANFRLELNRSIT